MVFFLFTFSAWATENETDCPYVDHIMPSAPLDLTLRSFTTRTALCFDEKQINNDLSLLTSYNRLKSEFPRSLQRPYCFDLSAIQEFQHHPDLKHLIRISWAELTEINLQSLHHQEDIVFVSSKTKNSPSSSNETEMADLLVNVIVGHQTAQDRYQGEKDKKLHANYGAAIALSTSGLSYVISDQLDLTAEQRRQLVRLSGPIMGTIVGILKEIVYDKSGRGHVDKHDALATAVGSGIIPIRISIRY
jgi:hypothetical protein